MKYRNIIFLFVTLLLTVIVFVMSSNVEGFQEGATEKLKHVKKAIVDAIPKKEKKNKMDSESKKNKNK